MFASKCGHESLVWANKLFVCARDCVGLIIATCVACDHTFVIIGPFNNPGNFSFQGSATKLVEHKLCQ